MRYVISPSSINLCRRRVMIGAVSIMAAVALSATGQASAQLIKAARSVTLITGDVIEVGAGAGQSFKVKPAVGRESIKFISLQKSVPGLATEIYVIPEDAQALIASGRLDRQLFNLSALLEYGYDDAKRSDLPLIVTAANGASLSSFSGSASQTGAGSAVIAASVSRPLASVGGSAARVRKSNAAQAWRELIASASQPGLGVSSSQTAPQKVWLDRKLKPTLDRSAVQIGATTAWTQGLTGLGVVVAVVDTGVDSAHPDLAGKVIAQQNFTQEADGDKVGHGTHVASTIAGTGAASSGRYKGVAPNAQLIAAKVCEVSGCPESAILAGMEWAVVDRGARIVNMSLGHQDAPGPDPLKLAVSRLTNTYGALFVISAGNSGPGPSTVSSPASADEALAVGAVDRSDQIAPFSSRGPRVGDKAIKPEITAPGMGIVAARAAGTDIGNPVGASYTALSGTSMAAPHVAGTAALLRQQHPEWGVMQLKSALIGSARPNAALTPFEQGAGRVDAAAAVGTLLVAEPQVLSLGTATYPHGDNVPIQRTVTYRNTGGFPITASIALSVRSANGASAPAGMFKLEPSALSIPAGGTASVQVTVDTRVNAANGVWGGALVATHAGHTHLTPIAIERESEAYDVTLKHTNVDGSRGTSYLAMVIRQDAPSTDPVLLFMGSAEGSDKARLPAGQYSVISELIPPVVGGPRLTSSAGLSSGPDAGVPTMFSYANLQITGPLTIDFDARLARPLSATPPSSSARAFGRNLSSFVRTPWNFSTSMHTFDDVKKQAFQNVYSLGQPDPRKIKGNFGVKWIDEGGKDGVKLYASLWSIPGQLPTGDFAMPLNASSAVEVDYGPALSPLTKIETDINGATGPDEYFMMEAFTPTLALSSRRMEYYYSNVAAVTWNRWLKMDNVQKDWGYRTYLHGPVRTYQRGKRYAERINFPVFEPTFQSIPLKLTTSSDIGGGAYRAGNVMTFTPEMFGDGDGRSGYSIRVGPNGFDLNTHAVFYREGDQSNALRLDFPNNAGFRVAVPPELGTYHLEVSATQEMFSLSPQVKSSWTFKSAKVENLDGEHLPLLTLSFKPRPALPGFQGVSADNKKLLLIDVKGALATSPEPPYIGSLMMETSLDDGRTWKRVQLSNSKQQWVAMLEPPPPGSYVSLRAQARDISGNAVEQTVIRAFRSSN
ncbi:S8 family serine peptidase [Roseateles sp. NT4]|uniref:S8 family serine peptidase n=1 Tax=Roseateles sp. NT4 TaxID=3453715 RepID=UPI003EEA8175